MLLYLVDGYLTMEIVVFTLNFQISGYNDDLLYDYIYYKANVLKSVFVYSQMCFNILFIYYPLKDKKY